MRVGDSPIASALHGRRIVRTSKELHMLLEQIADYAIREQTSTLSPDVIHHAKRAVIDWYAALLPGSKVATVPASAISAFALA